jgi:hypothetical protein
MIILEIEINYIFRNNAKGDPIVAAYPNTPLAAPCTLQWMQSPSRKQPHVFDATRLLDGVEDILNLFDQIGPDTAT